MVDLLNWYCIVVPLFILLLLMSLFYFKDPNLLQLCHATYFDHWLGVDEPPYGLELVIRLTRASLHSSDFMSFRDAILYWTEHFILRRLWLV